ncbi:MAG: ribonuclease HII [Parvularculaceae bacterium]
MAVTPGFEIEDDVSASSPASMRRGAGRGRPGGRRRRGARPRDHVEGLRRSQNLTEKRRKELAGALWQCARIGVGVSSVDEIDQMNILRASLLAMSRAVANLPVVPAIALVDGHIKPKLRCPAYTVIKGDAKSFSIAAATIIAKTRRADRMMRELARDYPDYQWQKNKAMARRPIARRSDCCGVTPHHRKSLRAHPQHVVFESSDSLC